jgi:hypothetical protein
MSKRETVSSSSDSDSSDEEVGTKKSKRQWTPLREQAWQKCIAARRSSLEERKRQIKEAVELQEQKTKDKYNNLKEEMKKSIEQEKQRKQQASIAEEKEQRKSKKRNREPKSDSEESDSESEEEIKPKKSVSINRTPKPPVYSSRPLPSLRNQKPSTSFRGRFSFV